MKKAITIFVIFLLVCAVFGSTSDESDDVEPDTTIEETEEGGETQPTMNEKLALTTAKNYLHAKAFSKSGLIAQLELEGFSNTEATYAVNNCGANWKDEAAKCAKNYLTLMAFSREELYDQLKYEGFTDAEATYGIEQAYE